MTKTPFSTTSKWSRFLLAALLSSALVGCFGIGDGSTDYKWQVSEADAGTYDITLDLQASTIVMTRQ